MRAPATRRESMSRPRVSVPRTWPGPGPAAWLARSGRFGLGKWSSGKNSADRDTRASHTAESQKLRPRRFQVAPARGASAGRAAARTAAWTLMSGDCAAMPNPRIEDAVEHVHDEVDQDEGDRDEGDDALNHDQVAGVDRLDQQAPDARQPEDDLHDEGPAHQAADVDAEHREQGERRRLQRVPHQDVPGGQPFG